MKALFILLFVGVLSVSSSCATPNFDLAKQTSLAIPASSETLYGQSLLQWQSIHGNEVSGFFPLKDGTDALGARLRMIEMAQQSIDLQYFLVKDDIVGSLFMVQLLNAADRGVRVRFLIDDIFTTLSDDHLFLLNTHPNIEVRLFNPIARRGFRMLNYLGDFQRANRRMHNKSLSVDGSLSVVGGRNIGAEYYNLKPSSHFHDFDVLTFGPAVVDITDQFDEFWNSEKSIPLEGLKSQPRPRALEAVQNKLDSLMQSQGATIYKNASNTQLIRDLQRGKLEPYIAKHKMIRDSVLKFDPSAKTDASYLFYELDKLMRGASREIVIVTPYLIPTSAGMTYFQLLRDKGIEIILVTNSLASTNHLPVHAAYEGYRERLLKMGIKIYETAPDALSVIEDNENAPVSTLHTKLVVIDRTQVFIGSLNFDPRSVVINSEMGLMIDSPELARTVTELGEERIKKVFYHLSLDEDENIVWSIERRGELHQQTQEPHTSWWTRLKLNVFKVLPEGQL